MRQAPYRQAKHTFKSKAATQQIMVQITAATAREDANQAFEDTNPGASLLLR